MDQFSYITLDRIIIGIYVILILLVLVITYSLLKSISKYRLLSKKEKWAKIIDEEIFLKIFEEREGADPLILKNLNSNQFKQFFIEKLKKALVSFTGVSKTKVLKIFIIYKLDQYSLKKLNHQNPYKVAEAIQEVTAMRLEKAIPKIKSLITNPNNIIKDEAQYSLIELLGFDALDDINSTNDIITNWQQIRLLGTVENLPKNHKERITKWLNSTNESVVIFTLKLIRQLQLLEYEDFLLNFLNKHNSPAVTSQIIKTFSVINSLSTADQLIIYFTNKEDDIQLEILKTFENIGQRKHQSFLVNEAINHPNLSIKKRAVKVLLAITSTDETIDQLEKTDCEITKSILRQIILENK